jgi:SOS-response transcriptional repressor LexA
MTDTRLIQQGIKTRDRIFSIIISHMETKKIPPTIREILEASGLKSESTIEHHLTKLEQEGRIERIRGTSRGIRIPDLIREKYSVEYRCLYPFSCSVRSSSPGSCRLHGIELVPFVTRKA